MLLSVGLAIISSILGVNWLCIMFYLLFECICYYRIWTRWRMLRKARKS